jgi:hypothetical protein
LLLLLPLLLLLLVVEVSKPSKCAHSYVDTAALLSVIVIVRTG